MKIEEKAAEPSTVLVEEDPLAKLSPKEAGIGAKLLPILTDKIAKAAEARYAAVYREQFAALQKDNETALTKAIDDLRETARPLSDDELAKLLGQEYGTFTVCVTGPEGQVQFTIHELPVSKEQKLLGAVRGALGPILKVVSSVEWASLAGASQLERLNTILELVPGALDIVCECVAICLDPEGTHSFLSGGWVKDHLGMNRIVGILMAQIAASRYRDFFSLVSRLFQQTRMTTR